MYDIKLSNNIVTNTDPKNISWSIPHYLDASVTVKLVVTEEESALLQDYLIRNWSYHFHITEFAFYETLFVLKQKLLRNDIAKKGYSLSLKVMFN